MLLSHNHKKQSEIKAILIFMHQIALTCWFKFQNIKKRQNKTSGHVSVFEGVKRMENKDIS